MATDLPELFFAVSEASDRDAAECVFVYANSEPQLNTKYSCGPRVVIAR